MSEEELLDLEFDDECYNTSWSFINMWYQRTQRLQRLKEINQKKE